MQLEGIYLYSSPRDILLSLLPESRGGSRGSVQGVRPPPPPPEDPRFSNTTGIMWFIGVEVEQETSAPPPDKNPGSAPGKGNGLLQKIESPFA